MIARLVRAAIAPWFVAALLASGCANNVGPDGAFIGGPCNDEFDCVTGTYCLRLGSFPGGLCTRNCDGDGDCRGASACIEIDSGACLLTCETDAECGREGYACMPQTRRGADGDVLACRAP